MFEFNTVEEAVEDLKAGRLYLLQMMRTGRMKVISYVPLSLQQQKMLILWQHMEKVLYVCQ